MIIKNVFILPLSPSPHTRTRERRKKIILGGKQKRIIVSFVNVGYVFQSLPKNSLHHSFSPLLSSLNMASSHASTTDFTESTQSINLKSSAVKNKHFSPAIKRTSANWRHVPDLSARDGRRAYITNILGEASLFFIPAFPRLAKLRLARTKLSHC